MKRQPFVLYKEVRLDLDGERARIDRVKYSKRDKARLHKVVDMVQRGDLAGAVRYTADWPRERREYIGTEIWQILWETSLGARFLVQANYLLPE